MSSNQPLAERMRPRTLDEYVGQRHLTGSNAVLQRAIQTGNIPSMILWGPPGVGKTTLATIIATQSGRQFFTLSAINSGVKDVREVIEKSEKMRFFDTPNPILFIDEIHRFSKSQQDSLLGAVERGIITLVGATTENPSFEVISPLLSRCKVYTLKALERSDLEGLLKRAIETDIVLKDRQIELLETEALLRYSGGDARRLLNLLELVVYSESAEERLVLTNDLVKNRLQENIAMYDKNGELHYDVISAFIKSIRGSDPNGALYWLARMLEGGEDISFIARRLIISAAEDVGLANPNALLLANACFQSINVIGMPEARIILSETVVYLATSPKSNASYMAINNAIASVKQTGDLPIPLHLRNAPTKLMRELNYGDGYKYSHDYPGSFVQQEFLPDDLQGTIFYDPKQNTKEEELRRNLQRQWQNKYKY